ncbi:MAG: SRPBCC family protein [Planctomycetales bacterium]|nr:SRPBCC family protein [bacterium]UNM07572.1 MAG: SRPBCC family protein [Planctomycetales bacterium]
MFEIRKTMHIPLPPQAVFNAARQVEKFPEVLPNLDSARVVSDEGNGRLITEWTATLKVGPMSKKVTWTERDSWNEADLSCRFELVKGDMKIYNGDWKFEAQDGGTLVHLNVDFELGIPMLGPMVNNIANQVMDQNCDELLQGLNAIAAAQAGSAG